MSAMLFDALALSVDGIRKWRLKKEILWRSVGALLLVILVVSTALPLTLQLLHQRYTSNSGQALYEVAHFLNTETANDALIESYDSELFFMLDRPYHYPADQLQVDLGRRTYWGQDVAIDYDPLAANPDYLVVGQNSRLWGLYDSVLETGAFRLVRRFQWYDVYERVPE